MNRPQVQEKWIRTNTNFKTLKERYRCQRFLLDVH